MSSVNLKAYAEGALDRSFRIFPLKPQSKLPATEHGFKNASFHPAEIDAWWDANPQYNIGIACGESNLCVLDFDNGEDLPDWLKTTKTLKVKTSRGIHVYFYGARESAKMFIGGRHVGEIKSRGGYVLGNGSVHPDGPIYTVVDDSPIATVPDEINELVKSPTESKPSVELYAPIYEGSRNTELTRRAGKLHRAGLSEESILRELRNINQQCCNPPLPDSEVEVIAHSIGSKPPDEDTEDVSNIIVNGVWVNGLLRGQPAPGHLLTALSVSLSESPLWERATPFNQIDDTPMEAIIPGMVTKGETTMLTGDFGSFKSYMTYFIADAVSEGGQFVRRTAQKHPVLVLDRENSKSTISLRRYLVGNLRDKQNVRLLGRFTSPTAPEITNPELLELCRTIRPFVIIDSMQDFHPGKKENDTDDMTQFSLEVNGLVDAGAVAVLIIHHVPKAGRGKGAKYRGATAIPGGVGGALFVEKVGRFGVKIEGFKTRDGEDSVIELLLHFPSQSEMENKTGRVTYSITRSGLDRTAELRSSVLDYVRAAGQRGELPSANEIAKSLGGDRNEIYALIKMLKDEKQLVCTDEKKGRLGLPNPARRLQSES